MFIYTVPNTRKRLCKQVLREIQTKRKERKEYAQIVIMTKLRAAHVFKEVLKINSNPYIPLPAIQRFIFFLLSPSFPMQTIYRMFLDNNLNFFYSHLFFKILQSYNLTLIYQQLFLT